MRPWPFLETRLRLESWFETSENYLPRLLVFGLKNEVVFSSQNFNSSCMQGLIRMLIYLNALKTRGDALGCLCKSYGNMMLGKHPTGVSHFKFLLPF